MGPEGKCEAETAECEAAETCTELENTICQTIPKEQCETVELTHFERIPPPYYAPPSYGK